MEETSGNSSQMNLDQENWRFSKCYLGMSMRRKVGPLKKMTIYVVLRRHCWFRSQEAATWAQEVKFCFRFVLFFSFSSWDPESSLGMRQERKLLGKNRESLQMRIQPQKRKPVWKRLFTDQVLDPSSMKPSAGSHLLFLPWHMSSLGWKCSHGHDQLYSLWEPQQRQKSQNQESSYAFFVR